MQRLAALVPRPRLHLIRFHGVLAHNAKLRALVVPQEVPQELEPAAQESMPAACEPTCAHHRPVRLSWAKLLKRVFDRDLTHCPNCGGGLEIIAAILEQPVIERILTHRGLQARAPTPCAGQWQGAASGLMLPSRDSSGDPGDQGRWSRLCLRVVGADGCGWAVMGNPWIASEKDAFLLHC